MATGRPLAVVTGASTGIGLELAKCCAKSGFDLLVVADEPEIKNAADIVEVYAGSVEALEADLATIEGVDKLYAAIGGRPVAALLANAGRGLGKGFLDQDFDEIRRVVDTNITGTIYLIHKVGRTCAALVKAKSSSQAPSPVSCPEPSKRSTTARRPSSIPSLRPFATN